MEQSRRRISSLTVWLLVLLIAASAMAPACADEQPAANAGTPVAEDGIEVVTTTTHIADMTRQIAGERASVRSLLPANADAHDFEPTPRDIEAVADADLVLEHGMALDDWAGGLVSQSGTDAVVVVATNGITPLESSDTNDVHSQDPHVWLDVANAKAMAANIRDALIEADTGHRVDYEQGATRYLAELDELDRWIREQIATIPEPNRKLVTNHDVFGYYVRAYGLQFVGAVIPSLDTQAQPSARETADLVDRIRSEGVKAIFTEASINPDLARQLAEEAGVTVVDDLYGDSLGPDGSGAETYIGMMRHNTTTIVEALR